jgi:hypothetical protein
MGRGAKTAAGVHGNAIRLLQNPADKISEDVDGLAAAVDTVEKLKAELLPLRAEVRQQMDKSRRLLTVGRDHFKAVLGPEYNERWDEAGLVGSLMIPRTEKDVEPLLPRFRAFLITHPDLEFAARDITANKFDELFTTLHQARMAVREKELVIELARRHRDAKVVALRKRLRGLIDELNMLLDPLDPMWNVFGFNMPGAQETPEVPEDVVVTVNGSNAALKWTAAPRTEYYRVWKKVIGVDEEPVPMGTRSDLGFTIEDLPSNAIIELSISAVNNGGESQRSEAVTVKT